MTDLSPVTPAHPDELDVGLHFDADERTYRRTRGYSQSAVKQAAPPHCLAHYRYRMDHPQPPTDAMRLGSLVDCLYTTPQHLGDRYIVLPDADKRTKAGKLLYYRSRLEHLDAGGDDVSTRDIEWAFEMLAKAEKSPLKKDDEADISALVETLPFRHGAEAIPVGVHMQAQEIVAALEAHPVCKDIHAEAAETKGMQVAMVADIDGYRCKGLADILVSNACVDLKVTDNASPEAYGARIARFGIHVQAAMYLDLLAANGMEPVDSVAAVESKPPYLVCVHTLDWRDIEQGRRLIRETIPRIAGAEATGRWPGYVAATPTRMPRWAREDAPYWESEG